MVSAGSSIATQGPSAVWRVLKDWLTRSIARPSRAASPVTRARPRAARPVDSRVKLLQMAREIKEGEQRLADTAALRPKSSASVARAWPGGVRPCRAAAGQSDVGEPLAAQPRRASRASGSPCTRRSCRVVPACRLNRRRSGASGTWRIRRSRRGAGSIPWTRSGLGTREVESLSSYVTRLAQAHCVDPYVLMTREIQPYIGERRLVWHWAMNGTRTVARRWVAALEMLTRRRGLAALTFLPWARVLDAVPLLRRERAWCPNCYEGWRTAATPVYEPLLWAMSGVTACPDA